ncbi:MAG: Rrf2 family transcriptional regulator [Peptostreptococcus sp.]|uniref:RrF2 family transcriptional regulator n=1 Tax=Peptostreptococcus sp. TaxID=1262 RepID=UPI002FC779F9
MQLNITTDYAIRIVLYLSTNMDEFVSTKELSDNLCISRAYVTKIVKILEKNNLVTIMRGNKGGVALKKEPSSISILEVISVMESTIKINRCLEEDRYCSADRSDYCKVSKMYSKIQKQLEEELSKTTVDTLV